ncbi:type II secretion system GspH family protein [Pirellulales bacterium]|nr:type II secretion system GspH family protein [Pirellulales bacterium]
MKKYNFIVTKPAGMTLIELLVVISILGLLTVVVLPALSGNRENNANRNASQQVSALISQSRNDAISAGRWAGFTVLPPASGLSDNGLDIARCRVPPPYRGDMLSSTVIFDLTNNLSSSVRSVQQGAAGDLLRILDVGVGSGDVITFHGQPQRYKIWTTPTPGPAGFNIRHVSAGGATPWPPTGVNMTFSIERQPRVVGSTISLSNESSIDMFWSGWGRVGSYNQFAAGDEVSVLFDDRGTLQELVINGTRRIINGAVFFLIGRVDRRSQSDTSFNPADDTTGANWQYPTSYWVVIDPVSGQTRIAECSLQSVTGLTAMEASQQYAREGLISQGL